MSLPFGSYEEYINKSTYFGMIVPLTDSKFVLLYRNQPDSYLSAKVATVSGTDISLGDVTNYYSGIGKNIDAVGLTDDKIVVVYRDSGHTDTGKLRIGDVSGTTINFGDEHTYQDTYNTLSNTLCRLTDSKFIISWELYNQATPGSEGGYARVCDVSGTTISSGNSYQFSDTSDIESLAAETVDDETYIISFMYSSGNDGKCRVATVSGTTISYGSEYTYHDNCDTGQPAAHIHNIVYIGGSGFVIVYRDKSDNHGEAKVGSISGTTINFGPGYPYTSGGIQWPTIIAPIEGQNFVIVIYTDLDNSNYGTAQIGTIYDNQIVWSDETVFFNSQVFHMVKPAFLKTYNRFAIAFRDIDDGNHGKVIIGIAPFEVSASGDLVIPSAHTDDTASGILFVHAHRVFATSWHPDTWNRRIR